MEDNKHKREVRGLSDSRWASHFGRRHKQSWEKPLRLDDPEPPPAPQYSSGATSPGITTTSQPEASGQFPTRQPYSTLQPGPSTNQQKQQHEAPGRTPHSRHEVGTTGVPVPRPNLTVTALPRFDDSRNGNGHAISTGSVSAAAAAAELARFRKIARRLQWKAGFLGEGYARATAVVVVDDDHAAGTGASSRVRPAFPSAETMFKLDFFEFYMLLERALVHLLGVFGIVVGTNTRGGNPSLTPSDERGGTTKGSNHHNHNQQQQQHNQNHTYHASVLAALDSPLAAPLSHVLGAGTEVRVQLARAKMLRNRWKWSGTEDEDDHTEGDRNDRGPRRQQSHDDRHPLSVAAGTTRRVHYQRQPLPLAEYDVELMLTVISRGLDAASLIAQRHVAAKFTDSEAGGGSVDVDMSWGDDSYPGEYEDAGELDDDWKFMVDAMDWESV